MFADIASPALTVWSNNSVATLHIARGPLDSSITQVIHFIHQRKFNNLLNMFNPRKLLSCLAAALLSSKGLARSTDGPAFQPNVGFYQPTDADMAMAQAKFLQYQSRSLQSPSPQPALPKTVLLTNASTGDLARAKALVDSAIKQQGEFNLWRLSNPHRGGKQSRETGQSRREDAGNGPSPPELTPDLLKAIKLTNDAGMQELHNNGTLQRYHEALDLRGSNLGHGSSNKAGNAAMAVPAVWDKGDWMAMQNHSFSRQPFQSDPNYKVALLLLFEFLRLKVH